jgi:hypothetical protein
MKDTKEIVITFANNTNYNAIDVGKELLNRYPELGNITILPISKDNKLPIIIFNENPDIQIQASLSSISFVVNHTYFNKLASICFDIVDTFETFNVTSVRIGYISSIFLPNNNISIVKEKYLKTDALEDIKDFNLSWYRELDTKIGKLNFWERILTDHLDFPDLLLQYDINTKIETETYLDMKYIKNFLSIADEYIEQRIDF